MLCAMSVAELPIPIDREKIAEFCRARGIARLELFGSALRADFRGDSDVDLLCTLRAGAKCGLFEWVALKLGLEKLFGRTVDLVSRPGIERSRNPYRRNEILKTARPIYVEG
jgi:predicted nucleotidyltransferase